ncbi:MAG: DMT family transporter [Pseudomonadota bacterium]
MAQSDLGPPENNSKPPRSPNDVTGGRLDRAIAGWKSIPGNLRGAIWMLLATSFFSSMLVMIKLAGQRMHVTEVLFFRQLVMVAIVLPVIIREFPRSLLSARMDLQAIRVGAAFFAMLLGFTAIINMPLATATTISFAKTFIITILAIVMLGESVGPRRWGALVVGFIGVVIVAWPDPGESLNIYALMALGSAACVGLVMILVRKLSQIDLPVTILTYQAVGIGILMFPPTLYFWVTPTFHDWILLFGIGCVSAIGQTCNIFALRAAEASALAPLDYTRLIFTLILGWVVFAEWPADRVFLGAALIVAAAFYTLHRERLRARKAATEAAASASSAT